MYFMKVLVFRNLLDEAMRSVRACDGNIRILENITYLGREVQNNGGSCQEVFCQFALVHCVVDLLTISIWHCGIEPGFRF